VLLARSTSADDAGLAQTLLNVVVLLPVALACVYVVAAGLAGPRLGVFAAASWALVPFALAPLWDARYEVGYEDEFLVQAVGLTDDGSFYAMVLLLAATAMAAQAIGDRSLVGAAAAGLLASAALQADASAVLYLAAPAAALLVARRWRTTAAYAVALLPGIVALVIRDPALPWVPDGGVWDNLHQNFLGIQEYFWSVRILQWIPVAGVIGVARRSIPLAVLLGLWLGAYVVAVGGDPEHTIGATTFLTALLPALPAYLLLAAAIPLLAPPLPSWRPSRPRFLAARR
jgi:hypothetical protein